MKKIKIILTLFIAMLGLLLVSCERDITEPVISSNPTAPTESDLVFTGSFNMSNADSLVTFSWSAADFGFASSTTYGIQLSSTSDFSTNVATILTTQKVTGKVKVADINTLILAWNFNIGTPVTVYYRISASVGTNVASAYSNIKSKSFTPYDAIINYPMVYVPGAYQGWSPGAENGRLFSYDFNSTYAGIIRINSTNDPNKFKITPAPNWDNDWGGALIQDGNNYSGTLVPKGSDLLVAPGCYSIVFNTSTLAVTLNKTNDWGIIGSATANGWNSDQNMFYNGQRKMWEITADFTAGEFKFRANDDWVTSYGDGNHDGILDTSDSNNISIATAGNYTIRFDPVKLTYKVTKN